MTETLLHIDHLAVEIAGHRALHDVVLDVPFGGSVGIVGETGSGKSLTCRAALGLLGSIGGSVVAGEATFDGMDLLTLPERKWREIRRYSIGFVPQTSLVSLDPVMRVGGQMAEAVRIVDGRAEAKERCRELLEAVEMPRAEQVLSSYPHELSGGMRQRVMIALALVGRPKLLVADEATTALDVTIQRAILELLDRLRRELDMALVLVTHDLSVVEASCETMTVMYAGATVERGPAAEICARPIHPYSRALIAAQPSMAGATTRLAALSGAPPELGEIPDGCSFAPRCPFATDVCRGGQLSLTPVAPGREVSCRRLDEVLQ
ncbi:MAG: ABC transporter ATP-binding protein [Actinobacteria bacterium]|nr:ABC transporter ATP-binding protein [Actinomycetota bacterium]